MTRLKRWLREWWCWYHAHCPCFARQESHFRMGEIGATGTCGEYFVKCCYCGAKRRPR